MSTEQLYKPFSFRMIPIELTRRILRLFTVLKMGSKGIKLWFYYNSPKFVRTYLWKKNNLDISHLNDAFIKDSIFSDNLLELKDYGITKFAKIESSKLDPLLNTYQIDKTRNNTIHLSLDSALVRSVIKDLKILEFLSEYYGGCAYLRENPTISCLVKNDPKLHDKPSRIYHSDGYRQVSLMMLLNDIDDTNIHMEYCLSSHKKQQLTYDRRRLNQEAISKTFKKFHLTGRKGSLFIFDTEGFHKGAYNLDKGKPEDYRIMMHANFHPGIYEKIKI